MRASDALLIASGTATLEAMLLRKPMVIAYRMAAASWALLIENGQDASRRIAEYLGGPGSGTGAIADMRRLSSGWCMKYPLA